MQASPLHAVASTHRRSTTTTDPRFVEFWAMYPRKVGRAYSARIYTKLLLTGLDHDHVLTRLALQCRLWLARGTSLEYVPHPSTWLNQHRWEDDIETELQTTTVAARTAQGAVNVMEWANGATRTVGGHASEPHLLRASHDGDAGVAGGRGARSPEAGHVLAPSTRLRLVPSPRQSAGNPRFPF